MSKLTIHSRGGSSGGPQSARAARQRGCVGRHLTKEMKCAFPGTTAIYTLLFLL